MATFFDGISNVFNTLINRRNALSQNIVTAKMLPYEQQRAIYRTGLGSKIVRLKAGYALNDTLQFENKKDATLYEAMLAKKVKKAVKFMLGFGRGIIVVHKNGDDLAKPLGKIDDHIGYKLDVFSGDIVTVGTVSLDLRDDRYMKPLTYQVRGYPIHYTRVVDFTYVEPTEFDLPIYQYGGISEFELIYNQIVNDGIVERASANILERNSNWVYKIVGFKEMLRSKKDASLIDYISKVEDMRGMYGATVIDSEDSAESIAQTLTNLADVDQITLRRLSMVTGIPLAILVGESVKGLNSTGDTERESFQDMIENTQSDYLIDPIKHLCQRFGIDGVIFKENQGSTPKSRIEYEAKAIENAFKLYQMGEDHSKYLLDRDVVEPDDWAEYWADKELDEPAPDADLGASGMGLLEELFNETPNQSR